jgi:hypothetical protein
VHKEHEGIVRLLGQGDGPGAIAQWRQHMTRASKAVAGREAAVLNLFEAGAPLTKK